MTIVSPYDEPIKIWHNVSLEDSHVVICWNGNDHFSGSTYVEKPFVRLRSIDDKIHVQGRCKKIVPVQFKVELKEEGNKKVEQSDDEKHNSDSENDLKKTVLMKTGEKENMSISSMVNQVKKMMKRCLLVQQVVLVD